MEEESKLLRGDNQSGLVRGSGLVVDLLRLGIALGDDGVAMGGAGECGSKSTSP